MKIDLLTKKNVYMANTYHNYTCPMHPQVLTETPGKCPLCGMNLVPAVQTKSSAGNQHHAGHAMPVSAIADFRKRFFIVLLLTIPVLLLSETLQHWLGLHIRFAGASYWLLLLSTVIFFYGGWPFLKGGVNELRSANPGMMTLIGFAISVAYLYSVAIVLGLEGMDFFWELATLILIMLLGHWIEMKSVAGASKELELLVQLMPDHAHLMKDAGTQDVDSSSLKVNDQILVKPGEIVPADGKVLDGDSFVNESMLTGESKPVGKTTGDNVMAGSINGNGALRVLVSKGVSDSYLSKVIRLVQDARKSRSKTQLLADRAARWLTLIAIVAGISTFLVWYLSGSELSFSLERMVTVIVICCPHALGLAVPLVVARSTSLSARHGLLIKNRTAFENARKISTLVFDKTGTLTEGNFEVSLAASLSSDYSKDDIIRFAAALEAQSEHPIATGILRAANTRKQMIPPAENFNALAGKGVEAIVDGKVVRVVSPGYLKQSGIAIPREARINEAATTVFVVIDNQLAGYISLSDSIRPDSAEAVRTLQQMNIKPVLLTGDHVEVARSVSEQLGMAGYFAGVLPHQKLEKIKELQAQGEFVAMTGDGINDAPALAQADIGIAVGSGSDIAAETAGIVLVNSNPKDVVALIRFGKATYRKMLQNLVWATGYNLLAMPLAAGVLYPIGILLSPAVGAALMSISTIIVAVNARFLRLK